METQQLLNGKQRLAAENSDTRFGLSPKKTDKRTPILGIRISFKNGRCAMPATEELILCDNPLI
jgi:hypothetical protein